MRLLGFDYGNKKIGVAVGQTITQTANPLQVIKNDAQLWQQLDALFLQWRPDAIVVGQPLLQDGQEHPLEKPIQDFVKSIVLRYDVTLIYRIDEHLSSVEARQFVGKHPVDAHAAALILESWLQNQGGSE